MTTRRGANSSGKHGPTTASTAIRWGEPRVATALVAHIAATRAGFPGHRIEVVSSVDEHDGYLRFAWELRSPDNSTVMEGVDFGVLAPDGRLASITGFFGPLSPLDA